MSPERSGSPPSEDSSSLTPKMSVPASPVAGTPLRDAQSPISLLLAVAQGRNRHSDDDLTNLAWLHERDVLKGMNINPSPANSVNSSPVKNYLLDQSPTSDYVDDSSVADSSNSSVHSPVPYQNQSNGLSRSKHPHNVPYDPLVHTANKPPYSFSCLIFMAIEDSIHKALPVKEIYTWILDHFPYFTNAPIGWKNSVRHNLSLNKCFQKVEKAPNLGKGSLWTVDPQYKPNLIQALTRSPFHPCSTIDPSIYINSAPKPGPIAEKSVVTRLPNPELFPYLSRKLATTAMTNGVRSDKSDVNNSVNSTDSNSIIKHIKTEVIEESLDAVDAAAVMLSLKNGPLYKPKKEKGVWQVISTSPSQDHTYSAADGVEEEYIADEAFESEDERYMKSTACRKIDFEDEEERKIKEGAETLLNLAGINTRKRYGLSTVTDSDKKMRLTSVDINENEPCVKQTPFKPLLLRSKRKESKSRVVLNNNEWGKHRRDLEINQHR